MFPPVATKDPVAVEQATREAYLAIAGFRFLVTSGLFRDGNDMFAVVMSGRDVLGRAITVNSDSDHPRRVVSDGSLDQRLQQ